MSSGTNSQRIITNNGIITDNNLDLDTIKNIVDNLPSSANTTATASDILSGKTAISQGQLITGTYQPNFQSKSLTITENGTTIIEPDTGYDGLSDVDITVNTPQPSGTINITENGTYDVTDYETADINVSSDIDWSQIGYEGTPQAFFDDFAHSKEIYDNWDSSRTTYYMAYRGDRKLSYFPLVDTSNVTYTRYMFPNCYSLKSVPLLNLNNVTDARDMFSGCYSLQDIPLIPMPKVTYMSTMFGNCDSLSDTSLNNIMAMCISATQYAGTKTLRDIGLSQAQAQTCTTLSNYQAFLDAGWTTGY